MAAKKQEAEKQSVVISEDDAKAIEQAIAQGQALIAQGKTKVDASMAIYRALNTQPQEAVVSAMIEGAGLTPKGALTYWYNCRRKYAKAVKK
ncbi:hypothetical protein [Nitratireductor sp. L15S-10]|uniref:hypothetical protein n=1 Tax=Nitratireductor sp. L15S-10 TaxID=3034028 RepID=UPI0032FBF0D3